MDKTLFRGRELAKQLVSFDGLRYARGITPTDIDAAFDFGNRLFVLLEVKHGMSQMPRGQEMCLERMCDNLSKQDPITGVNRRCLLMLAHDFHTEHPEEDVDASKCMVSKYRFDGVWRSPICDITVRAAIDKTLRMLGMLEYIV